MKAPETPKDEKTRLESLHALNILDSSPEERFDRLTRLAKRIFGVPIALVTMVDSDRQWFKSVIGLDLRETPRDISFCGHAILGDEIFTVPDASLDTRFHDNPLVVGDPHIRFYAGHPLRVANGSKLGTLCLIDRQPRILSEEDETLLRDLAKMAEQEIAAIQMATTDELTMLPNRRGFQSLARHALNLCRRFGKPASMFFFDLDDFKAINDQFGHAEGDRALENFAAVLERVFRESDVVGRIGGDEFVVFMFGANELESARALSRLGAAVQKLNAIGKRGYDLAYSVGSVAFDPERHATIEHLMREADAHMYTHKRRRSDTTTNPWGRVTDFMGPGQHLED